LYGGILEGKLRILYFLEDRAQEGLIKALVKRIAIEESFPEEDLNHDVRSGRGGSKVLNEFKSFLKHSEYEAREVDLLVVSKDGNCKGYNRGKRELEQCVESVPHFQGRVAFAVPDPHIERWFIKDQRAFKQGIGIDKSPRLPAYKCKKDYYKEILYQALREANVSSLFGGVEYAEQIVENMENLSSSNWPDKVLSNLLKK
jgi:hypothetical protein